MKTLRISLLILSTTMAAGFGFQSGRSQRFVPRPQVRAVPTQNQSAAERVVGTFLGEPLSGINEEEFERFRLGLEDFLEVEDAGEGLGPVFNGRSCAECHAIPAIGGSGTIMEPRAGILHPDGTAENFERGSLFPLFSIPTHEVQAKIPAEANVVAFRKSLPLFGLGLVEAVPEETLESMADPDDADGDGISGRAPRILDVSTGEMLVGRFGWKSQQALLITFGAEAYRDEMGITNDLFRTEACPHGVDCELLELIDPTPDPEDGPERFTGLRGIDNFDSFMRFLGPPPRGERTPQVESGEQVFRSIGCNSCHVATLETGADSSAALSHKSFDPYGDFLLHDIGTGDGIAQAGASPSEIRTAPLWGLRDRGPFLHDGRAGSIDEAIRMHRGEASRVIEDFESISDGELAALMAFLRSL